MPKTPAQILVVDDSTVIRALLSEYLGELGYEVSTAIDGQEGIEKALKGDFRVIFCDLHMPRKNGFQVYSEVSRQRPEIQFIMTDSLPDELADQARKAGAYCCLTKPFDLNEVKGTLEAVLRETEASWRKAKARTFASS